MKLWALSPKVWGLTKSLHINLTEIGQFYYDRDARTPIEITDSRTADGNQILQTWAALCEEVLCQIPPWGLKFSLSCNVSDAETGSRVIEPLEKLQPITGPSVCLGADSDRKDLKEISRKGALQLIARGEESRTSRMTPPSWKDLPREIRLDILSRTDLVDYCWPSSPNNLPKRDGFEIEAGKLLPRALTCCHNCTSTLSSCSCPSVHAAYSTTCTCPTVPGALFRVSKLMNSEATEIFFSRNRFILSGDFASSRRFLFNLSSTVAQHLRIIDLQISFDQLFDMRRLDCAITRDWESLVASIASLLQLQKVWLSIDAGDMWDTMMSLNDDGDHGYLWLRTSYANFLKSLRQYLRGTILQKFHVFLCWTSSMNPNQIFGYIDPTTLRSFDPCADRDSWWLKYESYVEKEIMGPSYESSEEGKPKWEQRMDPRYPHVPQIRNRWIWIS